MFKKQRLLIYQLQGTDYQLQTQSRYFPDFDLQNTVAQCLQIAYQRNTSAAIRHLRQVLSADKPVNSELDHW